MSIEILDEDERGTSTTARGLASALMALPRNYPVLWAIAWTLLLLGLCLAPRSVIPDENTFTVRKLIPHSDLAVHFTLFAGFVVSWLRIGGSPLRWLTIPALGLLLAIGTECAQGLPFIHRDPDLLDVIADLVGVVAGSVAWAILCRASAVKAGTTDPLLAGREEFPRVG
jgi:hypothetical protein